MVHELREGVNVSTVKNGIAIASAMLTTFLVSGAMAIAQTTPEGVVGAGAEDVKDGLLSVGSTVLPYAAIILVLTAGWRFARRFVRG